MPKRYQGIGCLPMGCSKRRLQGFSLKPAIDLNWINSSTGDTEKIGLDLSPSLGPVFDAAQHLIEKVTEATSKSVFGQLKDFFNREIKPALEVPDFELTDLNDGFKLCVDSKVSVQLKSKLVELPEDPRVAVESSITTECNPLVGLNGQFDVIPILANILFPGAVFFETIIGMALTHKKSPVQLHCFVNVGGNFGLAKKWTRNEMQTEWSAEAVESSSGAESSKNSAIWLNISGKAEVNGSVWGLGLLSADSDEDEDEDDAEKALFQAKAGVEVELTGAFEGSNGMGMIWGETKTDAEPPEYGWKATFTGVMLRYAFYADVGMRKAKTDDKSEEEIVFGAKEKTEDSNPASLKKWKDKPWIKPRALNPYTVPLKVAELNTSVLTPFCNLFGM